MPLFSSNTIANRGNSWVVGRWARTGRSEDFDELVSEMSKDQGIAAFFPVIYMR